MRRSASRWWIAGPPPLCARLLGAAGALAAAVLVLVAAAPAPATGQTALALPPPPAGASMADPGAATPARISFVGGQISFWRPGALDWAPAELNVPLAPGDMLFAAQGGSVEVQIGPAAFVRATDGTELGVGLDGEDGGDASLVQRWQFRMTSGHAALDVRQLAPGATIELDTPDAAFVVVRPGYYHADVVEGSTSLIVYGGGAATVYWPGLGPGGAVTQVGPDQQAIVSGGGGSGVAVEPVPALSAWDRWGVDRTDRMLGAASARYVPGAVYGADALDRYGAWRVAEIYGPVWVPTGIPAGWVPYSTGRWIWDPRFGWTWLDDAPWGWAPYHYGRWVLVDGDWAWAPGPIVARPVYAPALVVFLGGAGVGVSRPVYWAALSWGEPVTPWWGGRGVRGVPRWAGWGGPRLVNGVAVGRSATVDASSLHVYRNVTVTNAVLGVAPERFGRGHVDPVRPGGDELKRFHPVGGALSVQPAPASFTPAAGRTIKPPAEALGRPVVATPRSGPVSAPARSDAGHALASAPAMRPAGPPPMPAGPSAGPHRSVPGNAPQPQVVHPVSPGPLAPAGGPPPSLRAPVDPSVRSTRRPEGHPLDHEVLRAAGQGSGRPRVGPALVSPVMSPAPSLGKGVDSPRSEAVAPDVRPGSGKGRGPVKVGQPPS